MIKDTFISVNNIIKYFGKKRVLNDVSLDVFKGEIFGLLGPSGSGKTTLVKIISGLIKQTEGDVTVLDTKMPNLEAYNHIGFMSQSDALYGELTAKENLEFYASIYGLNRKVKTERIEKVLHLVELQEDIKKPVDNFSGGMKRRLSLAIALLHNPKVLILDEPTSGIDPILRKSIWLELERLSVEGVAIIVTTHSMDEALKCQRLGMIREGDLIALGTPKEIMEKSSSDNLEDAFVAFGGKTI